jgi:hypothetical protein
MDAPQTAQDGLIQMKAAVGRQRSKYKSFRVFLGMHDTLVTTSIGQQKSLTQVFGLFFLSHSTLTP